MLLKSNNTSIFCLVCVLLLWQRVSPGRILYLPFPQFSGIQLMTCMKNELKNYGHELWIIYPGYLSGHPILKDKDIHFIKIPNLDDIKVNETFVSRCAEVYLNPDSVPVDPDPWVRFQDLIIWSISSRLPPLFLQEILRDINNLVLSDEGLLDTLKTIKFDLAVVDGVTGLPYSVIPYKLDVPFCYLGIMQYPWHSGSPTLPSFVPVTGFAPSDRMTFTQRLINFLIHITLVTVPPYTSEDVVTKFAPEKNPLTLTQLMTKTKMWFTMQDVIADYPRPLMPNTKLIGGLCSKDAKPLPDQFRNFCDKSKHGIVVVSFGGSVNQLPDRLFQKLYKAFSCTKYDFVWRTDNKSNQSSKFMMASWLPQNDILGHPNTKLFVTHGGANGQFEGIYHGVPMLGIPLFGDQPYNTRRLQNHGYGLELDIHEGTAENFTDAVNKIIETPSYKANVMKASTVFRNKPLNPRQEAAYWMDYLITHGDTYIRSAGLDLPWYQYLCLDVILFLLCLCLFFLLAFVKCVCCCCNLCQSRRKKQKIE